MIFEEWAEEYFGADIMPLIAAAHGRQSERGVKLRKRYNFDTFLFTLTVVVFIIVTIDILNRPKP